MRRPLEGTRSRLLQELILELASEKIGKPSMELRAEVIREFGNCGERVFLRNLSELVKAGCMRREDKTEWDERLGRYIPVYFRTDDYLPEPTVWWCRICLIQHGHKVPRNFCEAGTIIPPRRPFERDRPEASRSTSQKSHQASARPPRRSAA